MPHDSHPPLSWPQTLVALARAWKPLLLFELLIALVGTLAIGPLLVALAYRLIEHSGETVLGNQELARFLLSPRGLGGLVLLGSVAVGLTLLEYGGLILLTHAALRGTTRSVRQLVVALLKNAWAMFCLAAVFTCAGIVALLPLLGLAALVHWLLLSAADINYFLDAQPPRFWIAAGLGALLALIYAIVLLWLFVRWALAVPGCVLAGQSWPAALHSGHQLARGHGRRLLLLLAFWQVIRFCVLAAAAAAIDRLDQLLLGTFSERLAILALVTIVVLLFDAIALQLIRALFAIGTAALVAREYARAVPADALPADRQTARSSSRTARWAVLALAVVPAVVSIGYAIVLARTFNLERPVMITAHRAGSALGPENSIAALLRSIAAGADYVEIDVQRTADGRLVLMHDRDLRRTTGDPRVVSEVNLADLADVRLRGGSETTAEPVPTLEAFLAACDDRIRLNLELKDFAPGPGLGTAVAALVREKHFTDRTVVSCFQMSPLVEVRSETPKVPIGIILSAVKGDPTRLDVNFLSINHRLARRDLVRRAHARPMQVHVWTVNDADTAVRLIDIGCDNLITSDPLLIRRVVDEYAALDGGTRMLLRLRRWLRD